MSTDGSMVLQNPSPASGELSHLRAALPPQASGLPFPEHSLILRKEVAGGWDGRERTKGSNSVVPEVSTLLKPLSPAFGPSPPPDPHGPSIHLIFLPSSWLCLVSWSVCFSWYPHFYCAASTLLHLETNDFQQGPSAWSQCPQSYLVFVE